MMFHKEGAEGVHLTPDDNIPGGLELNDTGQEIFTYKFSGVKLTQVCRIASLFTRMCRFLQFYVTWYTDSVKERGDRFFP